MPTYSLSSAPRPACSTGKTKRVSAQWERLMAGSRRARASSEDSGSEDGRGNAACGNNSRMSKAAAWMWYARGVGDAAHASAADAVVPAHKQLLAVNASSIMSNSSRKLAAAGPASTQPSRFKQEANPRLASDDPRLASDKVASAYDIQYNAAERHSANIVNHLYDEFELSRLHELLDQIEIDKLHSKLSAQLAPCRPSAAISNPLTTAPSGHRIKPLSAALHKLFKRFHTTVHNSSTRNSAMETGRPSTGLSAAGPHKLGSGQHVIHHHHHHYHHYRRSSLDSTARDQSPNQNARYLQEFVRRRRHSCQINCSQAQDLNNKMADDPLCTEDSVQHHPQRSTAAPLISQKRSAAERRIEA